MSYLIRGRKLVLKSEDPWLWQSDTLAEMRGYALVPLRDGSAFSLMQEEDGVGFSVPRHFPVKGLNEQRIQSRLAAGNRIRLRFRDRPDLRAGSTLTEEEIALQAEAAQALVEHDGYVTAGCGKGKTVIGIRAFTLLKRRGLVIVNTDHLLHQWVERFADFTNLLPSQIGAIKGRASVEDAMEKPVAVAMVQTLNHLPKEHPFWDVWGAVLVDEAHEAPAVIFYQTLLNFKAARFWAMTATDERTDGLWYLVPWVVGPNVFTIASDEVPTVRFLYTDTTDNRTYYRTCLRDENGQILRDEKGKGVQDDTAYRDRGRPFWPYMLNYLGRDEGRNWLIAEEIIRCVNAGRNVFLLTERKDQIQCLMDDYFHNAPEVGVIISGVSMEARKKMGRKKRVILATMQCLKKGADFPRFDTLIYGTPFSSPVTAVQTAGRVLSRNNPDKQHPLVIVPFDQRMTGASKTERRLIRHAVQRGWNFEEED